MSKKIKILLLIIVVIIVVLAIYLKFFTNNEGYDEPQTYTYGCVYSYEWNYVRCYNKDEKDPLVASCLGYYDLIGLSPEDGIKIGSESTRSTTCEGFIDYPMIYYDSNGKLAN